MVSNDAHIVIKFAMVWLTAQPPVCVHGNAPAEFRSPAEVVSWDVVADSFSAAAAAAADAPPGAPPLDPTAGRVWV